MTVRRTVRIDIILTYEVIPPEFTMHVVTRPLPKKLQTPDLVAKLERQIDEARQAAIEMLRKSMDVGPARRAGP